MLIYPCWSNALEAIKNQSPGSLARARASCKCCRSTSGPPFTLMPETEEKSPALFKTLQI